MRKIFRLLVLIHMCFLPMPIFATDTTKLPSGIEYTEISKYIDSYIAKNEKTNAGLSLAIFAGDDILYEGYYGYAVSGKWRAITFNRYYRIPS